MNNKPKTKLLTISLLCCGRADTTERCLKSLMPIREAIDSEIQVVDTGCSPDTRAIIEKYADEVFEFKWCNDFAKARNFQLDQANGKMFLFIDDDEWFLDTKYIISFFKRPDCVTYNIGGYFQRNYLDFEGKEYNDIEVVRMCTVTPETRFIGMVHEYIEPSYGNAMFMDAQAGHFGYVYTSDEDNVAHSMRNIPLLQEMIDEDPNNFRWPYQIAQEYKSIHDYEKLYEVCKDGFERASIYNAEEENENIRYRGSFICGMAIALHELGRHDELIDLYNMQAQKPTILQLPLAFLAYYAATIFFKDRNNEECIRAGEYYLKSYEKVGKDRALMFVQGGLFASEAFTSTKLNMIYCFLMTLGLEKDDYSALTRYYRKISWNDRVVRLNRGFMSEIITKASEIGYKKELRDVFNKFFTNNGFRNLIESMIERASVVMSPEELEKIAQAFKTTAGEQEIRLFVDIRLMEKEFNGIETWDSYRELIDNLSQYADMTITFQQKHDSWLLEEGDEEPLADATMLGQGLQQFMELADRDYAAALKTLKNLFGLRNRMNNALSELSRLYQERIKLFTARDADPDKFNEMYRLEESVLTQIAELDAAGRTDEAVATYKQLVEILQNTFGVDTLHI
ncbi:glycosyltransferase [Pseudobutyrivibrio sp. MD2005]|uniref:glycosyltransferase n=1 Tax=Pseudobutyrivibrio sp. MD2005 TaxID=1410616 RepID=UPI0004814219|nr:glycosyltransferase [Pseudobutyrivibrio sp. MD2005]